jgi:diguanylate cyclase (GGDEF)-like protein
MDHRRDSYGQLRDTLRWRMALVLAVLVAVLMVALGTLNTRLGLPDTAFLAWSVLAAALVGIGLLLVLPRPLGGTLFFVLILGLLVWVPLFGLQHGRGMQHWTYVFPPVVIFVLRPNLALAAMLAYGVWICAISALLLAPIEVVRLGAGYGMLVCFMYTYALLQQRAAAMLRYHSDHDALTNCLNRRTFNKALEDLSGRQPRASRCTLLLVDIDHFKSINDRHGHLVGDRVITEVAALLGRGLDRATPLFRYGGEEFAILLRDQTLAQGTALAERLRAAQAASDLNGLRVTVSIGVAEWQADEGSIDHALARADRALYAAKAAGRNRVVTDGAPAPASAPVPV